MNEPTDHKRVENTVLITGDSILNWIEENRLNPQGKVNVQAFLGDRIKDMYSYLQPLLVKCPKIFIIITGTNDALELTSPQIMDKLMELKSFIGNVAQLERNILHTCHTHSLIKPKHC